MDSDDKEYIGSIILFMTIGIFAGLVIGLAIQSYTWKDYYELETILQYQQECKIKEFYYIDQHRTLCDKIGVVP